MAEVLAPVSHRHLIFTIPKVLRGLFQRERRLLAILTRSAYDAVRTTWATGFEDRHALPGMVISIQTFGSYANWHPHLHVLVTNGVMTRDGQFLDLRHGQLGPAAAPDPGSGAEPDYIN